MVDCQAVNAQTVCHDYIDYIHVFMIRLRYYDHPGSQDKVSLLMSTKTYDKSASSSM